MIAQITVVRVGFIGREIVLLFNGGGSVARPCLRID